jgi:hypothetical protein
MQRVHEKDSPLSRRCGPGVPGNQQMSRCNSLRARIRRLYYLCETGAIHHQRLHFEGSQVFLTSKRFIDVDGAEYSIRRPTRSEVSEVNAASLLGGLDSGPLSIHRLKLYWAGRESSFVRWHGGIGGSGSERMANNATRRR